MHFGLTYSTPEYLSGHDETGGSSVDLNIPSQQANTFTTKCQAKVTELLIGESFNRRGIDGPACGMY